MLEDAVPLQWTRLIEEEVVISCHRIRDIVWLDGPLNSYADFLKGKVCIQAKWPISVGAYPSFCGMKQRGVFLLPPLQKRWTVHHRVTPAVNPPVVSTHLYTWVKRGTAQEHNAVPRPSWLEPRPLVPESSALTIRPPHLPMQTFYLLISLERRAEEGFVSRGELVSQENRVQKVVGFQKLGTRVVAKHRLPAKLAIWERGHRKYSVKGNEQFFSRLNLRTVPPDYKVFCPVYDYAEKVDHSKGYWNQWKKLGVTGHFPEIIKF